MNADERARRIEQIRQLCRAFGWDIHPETTDERLIEAWRSLADIALEAVDDRAAHAHD